MTAIQVAFELRPPTGLKDSIAAVLAGGASYVEIGTPLLKDAGVMALREAREYTPSGRLYADTKTIDFPEIELVAAREAGADIATMLAIATDEALVEGAAISSTTGLKVIISTMGYPEQLLQTRVARIRDLGLRSFVAHGSGFDPRTALADCLSRAALIRAVPDVSLIMGGGINIQAQPAIARLRPDTIIVGRAITTEPNLLDATSRIAAAFDPS